MMMASTNCRMPRPSPATADSNQRPNAAICGVISAKAAPTFTEARRQNRSSGSPINGQLPMLSGGGGIARFPAVKRAANPLRAFRESAGEHHRRRDEEDEHQQGEQGGCDRATIAESGLQPAISGVDGDGNDDSPHDRYDERPHDLEAPGDK